MYVYIYICMYIFDRPNFQFQNSRLNAIGTISQQTLQALETTSFLFLRANHKYTSATKHPHFIWNSH